MKSRLLLSVLIMTGVFACSAPQQTTQTEEKKEPEVYVFDDVSTPDTTIVQETKELPPQEIQPEENKIYFVQVGAFSTMERAQSFVETNKSKTARNFNITFSSQVQLYVVQTAAFKTREEAEQVRNELQLIPAFKDVFIVTRDEEK